MNIALAQLFVEPGEQAANLTNAESCVRSAVRQGAEVVLLPECLDLGWTHPSARQLATAVPDGVACKRLVQAAIDNHVYVCAGLVELCGDRLFNSAVLIDPEGKLLLHHRKIHELEIARDLYSTGDRLGVVDTPFGKIGLMICADGFAPFQAISRSLALMGAEIILSPCAWAVLAGHDNEKEPYGRIWLDNYGPVCREFGITIVGCSNVGPITAGPWKGRRCIGNSLMVGPTGTPVLKLGYGQAELACVDWSPHRKPHSTNPGPGSCN